MSRFVSAGGGDEPTERDEAWAQAQQKIDATRSQKEKSRLGEQEGGKSLFEHLQANKAAKQDAFEEAARLRNQFRSLDQDEVEFLDSVMESTRSKEAEVKQETKEQLEAFRLQQEEAEKAARAADAGETAADDTPTWSTGPRKRKKGREKEGIGGLKLRKTSTAEPKDDEDGAVAGVPPKLGGAKQEQAKSPPGTDAVKAAPQGHATASDRPSPSPPTKSAPPAALGLAVYSSDED